MLIPQGSFFCLLTLWIDWIDWIESFCLRDIRRNYCCHQTVTIITLQSGLSNKQVNKVTLAFPRSNLFMLVFDSCSGLSPVSPCSPNISMNTFASVPAPRLFPVNTLTAYFSTANTWMHSLHYSKHMHLCEHTHCSNTTTLTHSLHSAPLHTHKFADCKLHL